MESFVPTDITTIPTAILLALFGVGVAEFVGELFSALPARFSKLKSPAKILICSLAVAGAAATVPDITALQGAVIGFGAAGALTAASFLGKKKEATSVTVTLPDGEVPTV